MKFLVDMPLSPHLAKRLRELGHDALHASELGLAEAPDTEILRHAVGEDRVIVTADLDYPRLLALAGTSGPGLVLFRGGSWSEAESASYLEKALRIVPSSELPSSVVVVEHNRIRRRTLPIE